MIFSVRMRPVIERGQCLQTDDFGELFCSGEGSQSFSRDLRAEPEIGVHNAAQNRIARRGCFGSPLGQAGKFLPMIP